MLKIKGHGQPNQTQAHAKNEPRGDDSNVATFDLN